MLLAGTFGCRELTSPNVLEVSIGNEMTVLDLANGDREVAVILIDPVMWHQCLNGLDVWRAWAAAPGRELVVVTTRTPEPLDLRAMAFAGIRPVYTTAIPMDGWTPIQVVLRPNEPPTIGFRMNRDLAYAEANRHEPNTGPSEVAGQEAITMKLNQGGTDAYDLAETALPAGHDSPLHGSGIPVGSDSQ